MTLRERVQEWLDKYKAGEPCSGLLDTEDVAAIVAEYLHETPSGAEGEDTSERVEALQDEVGELRKKNEELRSHIHMVEREMDRMGGQIAAYKFVIRCNGVSGAEVRP